MNWFTIDDYVETHKWARILIKLLWAGIVILAILGIGLVAKQADRTNAAQECRFLYQEELDKPIGIPQDVRDQCDILIQENDNKERKKTYTLIRITQ